MQCCSLRTYHILQIFTADSNVKTGITAHTSEVDSGIVPPGGFITTCPCPGTFCSACYFNTLPIAHVRGAIFQAGMPSSLPPVGGCAAR